MRYLFTVFLVFSILNFVVPKAQKELKEIDRKPSNVVSNFIQSE